TEIENQSDYQFFYKEKLLRQSGTVSINVSGASVEDVLNICLKNQQLSYTIVDKIIVLKVKKPDIVLPALPVPVPVPPIIITGTVRDENGNPLASVSVLVKGTSRGTTTGTDGTFTIDAVAGDILELSIVGYKKQTVTIKQIRPVNL